MARYRWLQFVGLLCVAAILVGTGLYLSRYLVAETEMVSPELYQRSQIEVERLRKQLNVQKGLLLEAQARHEVDRAALELVRQDLARQREEITDLDEGMRFYRGLMAPGEIAQGFSLQGLELVRRETGNIYAYRLVVQQEARKHEPMRGELFVTVQGVQNGQVVSYPLPQLARDIEGEAITLRFLYFQVIEGELQLMDGFEPQSVEVVAELSSPRKMEVREQYPWHLQEKFTHVGK
ncbi:MAG: DUF6776 family protein [Parahaliea sp.]